MRYMMGFVIIAAAVAMVGCDAAEPPTTQLEPESLTFALYSDAQEVRLNLENNGAEVSTIRFQGGAWSFSSSLEPEDQFSLFASSCESEGYPGHGGDSGETRCDLYSEAQTEKNAMEADGWECTDIEWNGQDEKWVFEWKATPSL